MTAAAPSGVVTFLFTDVEGSTGRWEADADAMRTAYIRAEYYAGRSAFGLGAELGLSRSQVHRIVAAGPPNGYHVDGAEDVDDEAMPGSDYEPVPQFRFAGLAAPEDWRGNPLVHGNGHPFGPAPRAVDGRGVSVPNPELDIWRIRFPMVPGWVFPSRD